MRVPNTITPAIFATDSYKLSHADMYPEGMEELFSTWVPRSDKIARATGRQIGSDNSVVFFGISMVVHDIVKQWNVWFGRPEADVVKEYEKFILDFLKVQPTEVQVNRIRDLHRLGHLPLVIRCLEEGTVTKTGVVQLTIFNTYPEFAWLTNYMESYLSTLLWSPQVVASIARNYRILCDEWADKTCDNNLHVDWQCHDFSFRGRDSLNVSETAQIGHLLYFRGTDTLAALFGADYYYDGFDTISYGSVPATEHSVMCAGGQLTELQTFDRLLDIYPTGIVSIVSDTWDFWKVLTETLPQLKDKIMARDGKVVIRPDSGDPVDIICGNLDADPGSPAYKGAIELLWEVFGGEVNHRGYKVLDSHIGLIYGDSITLERAKAIFERLAAKGFASSNVVLGIGSYTYQCNTRDTYGFAMKATAMVCDGVEHALFKDPVTDDGIKRSFRGYVSTRFNEATNEYYTVDGLTRDEALYDPEGQFHLEFDFEFLESPDDAIQTWDYVRERAVNS